MRASGLCGVGVPGAQRLGGGWRGRLLVLQGAGRKDTPTRSRNRCPHASRRQGSAALLSVPSLASCFLPSEPSLRYDDPEDRGQQRGEGGPWGRLPSRSRATHLCSRPCPPSSFPSRDSSLRRSQMPPRPGMTGIPRRSWQTGALLAQVPGPRPALQGRESHRPLGAGGGLRRSTRRRPRRSRPTGSLALSERLSCFPFPGFLAAKL